MGGIRTIWTALSKIYMRTIFLVVMICRYSLAAEIEFPDKLSVGGAAAFRSSVTVSGNIGVGTTSPLSSLQVISSTQQAFAAIVSTGPSAGQYLLTVSTGGDINAAKTLCIAGVCKSDWTQAGQWIASGSSISYAGSVAIGTTAASAQLSINSSGAGTPLFQATGFLSPAGAYRKPLTISNPGSALTDYQVVITTDTSALVQTGKMRSDCNDIRFTDTDGTTSLSYWIESGCNSSSTKMWVKIPSIPTGSKTIYFYYGNSGASQASSGSGAFLVFDDFSANQLGTYWLGDTSAFTISGGELSHINGSTEDNVYHQINLAASENWRIYGRLKAASGNNDAWIGVNDTASLLRPAGNGVGIRFAGTQLTWQKWVSGSETSLGSGNSDTNYHALEISKVGTTFKFYYDNSLLDTETIAEFNNTYLQIETYATGYYDFVYMRKFASSEPTAGVGAEELSPTTGVTFFNISETGKVGIGTSNPGRKLFVNGDAGGTTAWYNDSDERLKKNVKTIENALEKTLMLRGVNFEWKDASTHPEGPQIGLIAQETFKVLPEVVDKPAEYYSIQYGPIAGLLIEAIKEQQKKINAQEEAIKNLNALCEGLKAKDAELEAENKALDLQIKKIAHEPAQ